jgi:hypothetical protein
MTKRIASAKREITVHQWDIETRFWSKVEKTDTCWNWTGSVNDQGYGTFNVHGKPRLAHRIAYGLAGQVVPPRLDHTCHNPACVNPEHTRPITPKQNQENRRGPQANNRSSGIRGVHRHSNGIHWQVRVGKKYVGIFTSLSAAEAAAVSARNEMFTHNDLDRAPA